MKGSWLTRLCLCLVMTFCLVQMTESQNSSSDATLCSTYSKPSRPYPNTAAVLNRKRQVVGVSCDSGYFIQLRYKKGTQKRTKVSITCNNGSLAKPIPKCTGCPRPANISNGTANFTELRVGAKVRYKCNKGFWLSGTPQRRCGKNLKWSGKTQPMCNQSQNSSSDGTLCSTYSKLSRPYPNTAAVLIRKRQVVGVSCDSGYFIQMRYKKRTRMRTKVSITCNNGSLAKPIQKCKGCPRPANISNGTAIFTKLRVGAKVRYKCNKGFWLSGTPQRRCGKNLKWSGKTQPMCNPNQCRKPKLTLLNGNVTVTDPLFHEFATVSYQCNEGYELRGEEDVFCLDNIWSSSFPYCVKKRCQTPGKLENGRIYNLNGGGRYYNGTTIRFFCNSGFRLYGSPTRTCQADFTWNGTIPTCDNRKSHCPNPGVPDGMRKQGKRHNLGDAVKYSCLRSGDKVVGSKNRVCQTNRTWSGTQPKCMDKDHRDFPSINETAKQLGESFVNELLQTTCSGENITCPKPEFTRARTLTKKKYKEGLDLIFVLDGSSSIKERNFKIAKEFVLGMVKIFGIDTSREDGTQIACVTFGTSASIEFNFGDVSGVDTKYKTINKIKEIQYRSGGTAMKPALEEVRDTLLTYKRRVRKRKTVIFIITDGNSNIGGNPKKTAGELKGKKYNAEIYVIGIGKRITENALNVLASNGPGRHIFTIKKYKDLEQILNNVVKLPKKDYSKCGRSYYKLVDTRARVVGGSTSKRRDWPWMVELEIRTSKGDSWCGGTLIDKEFILSAAHCFDDVKRAAKIKAFLLGNEEEKERIQYEGKKIFVHPGYNRRLLQNDIALVKIKKLDRFTRSRQRICLPENPTDKFPMDSELYFTGWGTVKHAKTNADINVEDRSKKLKQVKLPRIRDVDCQKKVENKTKAGFKDWHFNSTTQFCAADVTGKNDVCKGDSGGPGMLYNYEKETWLQVGIVSWGYGCANEDEYGFYTKVAPFINWIRDTVNINKSQ